MFLSMVTAVKDACELEVEDAVMVVIRGSGEREGGRSG